MLALESITQILNNEYQIQMSQQFMLRALEVSRNALPACQPNPPVGCVLVKDGEIVSEGHTQAIEKMRLETLGSKLLEAESVEVKFFNAATIAG